MKKEYIFLALSIILPVVFIFSLWGYYGYYSSKINPQYDFVYASPYQGSYYDNNTQKSGVYNPYDIQSNGMLKVKECEATKDTNPITVDQSGNLLPNFTPSYDAVNVCRNINTKTQTYYRYDIKNKSSKSISFDELTALNYLSGKESPDGYTFSGDMSTQPNYTDYNAVNIFYASSGKNYDNATLSNKSGANVSLKLNDGIYNRLFIGYIKQ